MTQPSEDVNTAAAKAATRWKVLCAGLAIVAFTNVANLMLNTVDLEDRGGLTCIAVIGNDVLASDLARRGRAHGDKVMVAR